MMDNELELPEVSEYVKNSLTIKISPKRYKKLTLDGLRNHLINYLIGDETWRYDPEPTYGPTGKGNLKSIGIDGLNERKNIHAMVYADENLPKLAVFFSKVETYLNESFK